MRTKPDARQMLAATTLAAFLLCLAGCSDIEPEAVNTPPGGFPATTPGSGKALKGSQNGSFAEPFVPSSSQLRPVLPSRPTLCPQLEPGRNRFEVAALGPREAELFFDSIAARTVRGAPVIIFWHDRGATPQQVQAALGPDLIDQIAAQGGVVVAPFPGPPLAARARPWTRLAAPFSDDDLLLTDTLVGCLRDELGIDPFRIHTLGFGDGAIQSAILAAERASFIASSAVFSGGLDRSLFDPTDARPGLPQPSLVFYGGDEDRVDGTDFGGAARLWWEDQMLRGRFSAICNHERGHVLPDDVQSVLLAFFLTHPYGLAPSPWARQPPSNLPAFCELPAGLP